MRIFHLLVHTGNGYNGQCWARQKPGPSFRSPTDSRDQTLGLSQLLSESHQQAATLELEQLGRDTDCCHLHLAQCLGFQLRHLYSMLESLNLSPGANQPASSSLAPYYRLKWFGSCHSCDRTEFLAPSFSLAPSLAVVSLESKPDMRTVFDIYFF